MYRSPPAHVQRVLRQEVNYCCPVPDCAEPFLTWHHFDPPWNLEQHHRPEGMIALCVKHHRQAEGGIFGIDEIRKWKKYPNQGELAKTKFEWYGAMPLIRLGGCYAARGRWLIIVNGEHLLKIFSEDRNLVFNFTLRNEANENLARMENNLFSYEPSVIHDLSVSASGHQIKIWLQERQIGIDLEYSRKTIQQIDEQIQRDQPGFDSLPFEDALPEPIHDSESFYQNLKQISDFREVIRIGFQRNDQVGTFVRWHAAHCMDSDGRIPFLNFKNCRLNSGGRTIAMRNGRFENMEFCAGEKFEFSEGRWSMS